jgi:ubiquinone/menaquinone biosynthesis C-methylase UbiE
VDEQELKEKLRETFNTIAEGYDKPALRFFTESAKRLLGYLKLMGDEHVLDVGTVTGHAAIAIAGLCSRVGLRESIFPIPCSRMQGRRSRIGAYAMSACF